MIRARAADGWATLWPLRDLGPRRAVACAAVGTRAASWRAARGWALLLHRADRVLVPHRLPPQADADAARRVAAAHLGGAACPCCGGAVPPGGAAVQRVDLYQAVTVGAQDRILWRRVEVLDVTARPRVRDWYVTTAGAKKPVHAMDPEAVAIAELSKKLAAARDHYTADELRRFMDRIKQVDWTTATEVQQEGAWSAALAIFRQADVRDLVRAWGKESAAHAVPAAQGVRERLRETILPQLPEELPAPAMDAVRAVGEQAGLFVRDHLGLESEWLTARGREIVSAGLRDGLGREAIGGTLRTALPEMWSQYGASYSNTVASNAMVRARSIAQVGSYEEAGIERLTIVAMLDERTCELCEFMDGQVIEVASARKVLDRAAEAESIDELREGSPFLRVTRDPDTGTRGIATATETTVKPTGEGPPLGGNLLATQAGVGAPPFHHRCRCTTVPA